MFLSVHDTALRTARLACMVIAAGLIMSVVAGCGSSSDSTSSSAPSTSTTTTPSTTSSTEEERVVPLARAAIALGRRFDALVAAYAPVTARVNFLVTAETLRRDARSGNASDDVVAERTGAVRVEAQRMRGVLLRTRQRVAAVVVAQPQAREAQTLLLTAIDERRAAIDALDALLDAQADPTVGDSAREELDDTWRASWDAALRAARDATTLLQTSRDAAGLEPGLEEAIR